LNSTARLIVSYATDLLIPCDRFVSILCRYLSSNAFIMVAIDGEPFCIMAWRSFTLLLTNGAENGIFFGVFPMFVPSLSWQNDRFYI
jgi:hypothetical protein